MDKVYPRFTVQGRACADYLDAVVLATMQSAILNTRLPIYQQIDPRSKPAPMQYFTNGIPSS